MARVASECMANGSISPFAFPSLMLDHILVCDLANSQTSGKAKAKVGSHGKEYPRSFSPGATPKPDHPFKTRGHTSAGVFHRHGLTSLLLLQIVSLCIIMNHVEDFI